MRKSFKATGLLLAAALAVGSMSITGFAEEVTTLYNPNFSIEIIDENIKKVTDGEGRELILVDKALEEVPEEYADDIVIRTPVENAVFLSSTQVCTFRAVADEEVISAIGAVTGSSDSWDSVPAVKEAMENGEIIDVTGDGGMGEPDYEKIQELDPELVFVYGGEYGQVNEMAKFDELGINYAVDNEYLETNYLARMEWMRFILTFFNADEEVDAVMAQAQANVDAAKAAFEGQDPVDVAFFNVYNGTVYPTSDSSWVGSMIADMNGINVMSEFEGSQVTAEAAYEVLETADVIVYTSTQSYCPGMDAVVEAFPLITDCEAYENGRVYQYSDLFWHGIDQSDIMATDIAAILYPELFADTELTYYVQLEK